VVAWTNCRRSLIALVSALSLVAFCTPAGAQFGGFAIGGPDGVVIGGGEGLRIGGSDGVQFGGGQGAKFGGPSGVQFGGGEGARFGGPSGVQFGAGEGARFGGDDGVQFGGGAGAKLGPAQIGGQAGGDRQPNVNGTPDDQSGLPMPRFVRPITLSYPVETKGSAKTQQPIDFTLNDWKFTIRPGETVNLRSDQLWIIRLSAGPERTDRRYSLPPGHYTFKHVSNGWDLVRSKREPPPVEQIRAPSAPEDTSRALPRKKATHVMR
jgi:hypothetical protein